METAQAPLGIQAPLLGVQQGLDQSGLLLYRSLITPLLQGQRFLPLVSAQQLTLSLPVPLVQTCQFLTASRRRSLNAWDGEFPTIEFDAIQPLSEEEAIAFEANQNVDEGRSSQATPTMLNEMGRQSFNHSSDAIDVVPSIAEKTELPHKDQPSKTLKSRAKAHTHKRKSSQPKAKKADIQSVQWAESSHETIETVDIPIADSRSAQFTESSTYEMVEPDDMPMVAAGNQQDAIDPLTLQHSLAELVQPLNDDQTSPEPTFAQSDRTDDVPIPLDSASEVDVVATKRRKHQPLNLAINGLETVNGSSVDTPSKVIKVEEIVTKSTVARGWQHEPKPVPTKLGPFILKSASLSSTDKALLNPSRVRPPSSPTLEGRGVQSPPELGDLGGNADDRLATFIPQSSNATDTVVQTAIAYDHAPIIGSEDTADYESNLIQEAPLNFTEVQLSPNAELAEYSVQFEAPIAESEVHKEAIPELDLQPEEAIDPIHFPTAAEDEPTSTQLSEHTPPLQHELDQAVEPEVLPNGSVGSTNTINLPSGQEQESLIQSKIEPTSNSENHPLSDNLIHVLGEHSETGDRSPVDTVIERQTIESSIDITAIEDLHHSREIPIQLETEESSRTDIAQITDPGSDVADIGKQLEEHQSELCERLEQPRSSLKNESQVHQEELTSQPNDLTRTTIDHPIQASADRSIEASDLTTSESSFSLNLELPLLETANDIDQAESPIAAKDQPVTDFQQISDLGIQATEPFIDHQPTIYSDNEPAVPGQESHPKARQVFEAELPFDQITESIHGYAVGGQVKTTPPSQGAIAPSDTVPAMLTPGEFVINARDAQKHLPLLHHLNQGGDVESAPIPTVQSELSVHRAIDEPSIADNEPLSDPAATIARKPVALQRQSKRRSPPDSTLFRSAIPLSEVRRQALSDFAPLEPSILDQPHSEPAHSYASPSLIFRSVASPSGSSSAPLPDEWNSIDELLGGSGDTQSFSDRGDNFPDIASPVQTVIRRQTVQGFADGGEVSAPSSTETSDETSAVSETIEASTDSDTQADGSGAIESLAQEIYQRLRQRLEIERERQGFYSGRLPW